MTTSPQPTVQEIREELDRLLEDAAFRRAPSHSRLLRYLVERKTAGDDGALCEAGIAMAVFQRDPAAYDAEIDPIVRVSIGRLRDRLEKHYQRFERVPETIIMLPKGRYAPEFRHKPPRTAAKAARGVAVMHTRNLTGDPALDALAQGLSDRLSEALVLMGLPRVIAQASVQQAQGATQSPVEIGRQLDVAEIIETTLSPEANQRLRISARLIRAADAELAWAEVRTTALDNPYAGIDALFDAVLARFATAPGAQSSPANGGALPARPPLPAAARSKIESARMLIAHLNVASIEQARTLLTEVTSEYPDAADAWALRGRACVRRLNFADVAALPLVAELQECARTALALNAEHIEALALRALALHWSAALPEAEAHFRDALRAAPNHTSARLGLAWLLLGQGRFDEALTELDAAGSFDPLSLNVLFNRASALMFARRHDDARAVLETGMRAGGESPFALSVSAGNELFAGNLDAASAHYERLAEVAPDLAGGRYGLAYVAAVRGDRAGALSLQEAASAMARGTAHICDAELSSILRDRAVALAALRQAVATMQSARLLLGVNPMFEWLADDPDFQAVLSSIGLQRWCGERQSFPS
ncbi:MAG: tetratricopeptide repeat protein [Betaproteobacteria bacterium]|nr:tetratricopeptide repeat protein [Betaproteobacteria bacterium]